MKFGLGIHGGMWWAGQCTLHCTATHYGSMVVEFSNGGYIIRKLYKYLRIKILKGNISNFVPPVWKLHNPYCLDTYTYTPRLFWFAFVSDSGLYDVRKCDTTYIVCFFLKKSRFNEVDLSFLVGHSLINTVSNLILKC